MKCVCANFNSKKNQNFYPLFVLDSSFLSCSLVDGRKNALGMQKPDKTDNTCLLKAEENSHHSETTWLT